MSDPGGSMSAADDELVERLLAAALVAADPVEALARAARDRRLPADAARMLAAIDADGFRIAALLVARLRFERLQHGHAGVAAWLDDDPAGFTEAFRRYHAEVPPTALFPPDEALAFDAWLAVTGTRR